MKTIAAIDLGSNTAKLLVAKVTASKRIIPLFEDKRTPRLADGLSKTGRISTASLRRAVSALQDFKQKAEELAVDEIQAVATQAVRQADNQKSVKEEIHKKTGIHVRVISGRREAELTYLGAVTGINRIKDRRILFDIGGASTEFVLAEHDEIIESKSIRLGAVAVTESFRTDRISSPSKLMSVKQEIADYLSPKLKRFHPDTFDLLSSGGTISAYKRLQMGKPYDRPERAHGRRLKVFELNRMIDRLGSLKLSDRQRVIIFEPERANVIVAGGLILSAVCDIFEKNSLVVSTRSLRWGFLISRI